MSYQLELQESVAEGVKRIAREQLDQALADLTEMEDRDEAVHDARKCFKKIRAALRWVRDEIGEDVYQSENVCYRDAGRRLAAVRDTYVLVETLDAVKDYFAAELDPDAFASLRASLVELHDATKRCLLEEEGADDAVVVTLRAARPRIADWPIEAEGVDAFYKGLRRVYKRGRKGFADAYDAPSPEAFHDWRKRVKYLWYHTRIFTPIWPALIAPLADELHELADYLGDDHDLIVLRDAVVEHPEWDDAESRHALFGLIDQRRATLQARARPLGARLYVESKGDFVDRVAAYWRIWREWGNP